jgi:hypothetical protein
VPGPGEAGEYQNEAADSPWAPELTVNGGSHYGFGEVNLCSLAAFCERGKRENGEERSGFKRVRSRGWLLHGRERGKWGSWASWFQGVGGGAWG